MSSSRERRRGVCRMTRLRAFFARLAAAVIADDPHQDLSRLDRLDGRH